MLIFAPSFGLFRPARPRQQFSKIVIHARHPKIGLPLEGLAGVVDPVRIVIQKFDNGQDKIIGLVQRIKDLVTSYSNRISSRYSSLYLDEAQLPGSRHTTFNIISKLFGFPISRLKT